MYFILLLASGMVFSTASAAECHHQNTDLVNAYSNTDSNVESWKACGTKCTNDKDCDVWLYDEFDGRCGTYAETTVSQTIAGDYITGRSGCPYTGTLERCLYGREHMEQVASLAESPDSYGVQQQGIALVAATYRGDISCMQTLINAGANIEAEDTRSHKTALDYAVFYKNKQAIDLLLKSGADIEARYTINGWTYLILASAANDFDMVEYFFRRGANASVITYGGNTILHEIIRSGTSTNQKPTKSFIFILEKEPNLLEHTNNKGFTPYLYACYFGDQAFLDYLKDVGANTQATTNDGKSCSVLCKEERAKENNGCTPSDQKENGWTIIQHQGQYENTEDYINL